MTEQESPQSVRAETHRQATAMCCGRLSAPGMGEEALTQPGLRRRLTAEGKDSPH